MKVLLVQSYLGRYESEGVIFPFGLCCVASTLKEHDVHVLDLNVYDLPFDELKKEIISFQPDIVGISLRNVDTTRKRDPFYYFKFLEPTVQFVKKIRPSVKIMIGGAGFSMFARKIMERIPKIDFGIYLEGDESTAELLNNLNNPEEVKGIFIRKDGTVVFTGSRALPDVGKLPMPRREFVDVSRYKHPIYTNIGIQTKRGCSLKCAYCSYPFLNGRKIRARTVTQVVDEIEYLIKEFNVRRFMFVDSVFNVPKGHAEDICREIINKRLQVEWSAWFNIKEFSEGMLDLAVQAGCKNFSFSPDAASNMSLKALGKDISEEDISRVIKLLRRTKNVRTEINCFCTPPMQDFSGFLKTLLLFVKVNFYFLGRGTLNLSWIRIEPDTKIYEMALEENIISKETELLPSREEELSGLFYSCPATRKYADPFFGFILDIQEKFKPYLKKILSRKTSISVKKCVS